MKKIIILPCLIFTFLASCQELQQKDRVHGPAEYYTYELSKISSLLGPTAVTAYKAYLCEGASCPDPIQLGIAGVVWMVSVVACHKYIQHHPRQKETTECTVVELTNLIASYPEIIDNLSVAKRNDYIYCPLEKTSKCKLHFSVSELEKMFEKCITYYGLDANGKPCGQIIVDDKPIMHPLITAWAKNRHYWHW